MKIDNQKYSNLANSVRILILDSIREAGGGHPGLALAMADVVAMLFADFLKFVPEKSDWIDRDRFILSAGHGSLLLYSILYLLKYPDVTLEELKRFRKFGSRAAGHPEYKNFGAIETSTGPLGQGIANAVGLAISERLLSEELGKKIIDHKIYVLAGDGCLMEGISHEAASLAGHLKLNKLILLFDNNKVSIDGPVDLTCSDDHMKRFESYGWKCFEADGHNYQEIYQVLSEVQNQDKPCFISFNTMIGQGSLSDKIGQATMHSGNFTKEEVYKIKNHLQYPLDDFVILEKDLKIWQEIIDQKRKLFQKWEKNLSHVNEVKLDKLKYFTNNEMEEKILDEIFSECQKEIINANLYKESSRKSSQRVLKFLAKSLPQLVGGSADLSDSTCVRSLANNYIYYGIREHAMAGIMNGLALDNYFIPYGSSFLVFSDYMRPAIRLACLMKLKLIYIMTHDSIGVGEDGPTHQPVEHLASLRAMPNLYVFRPADAIETLESWLAALSLNSPSLIALTRQDIIQPKNQIIRKVNYSLRGAYIIEQDENYEIIIMATGSEVSLALEVREILTEKNIKSKIISIPCFRLFEEQEESYKKQILDQVPILRVAIEASTEFGWHKYIGENGLFFGVGNFGSSGSMEDLYKKFGLTAEKIAEKIISKLEKINEKNSYKRIGENREVII